MTDLSEGIFQAPNLLRVTKICWQEVFQDLLAALEKAWKRSQNSEERDSQNKRCALRTSSEINDSR